MGFTTKTIDGQTVYVPDVVTGASLLSAETNASLAAVLGTMTAHTNLPYGFSEGFEDSDDLATLTNATLDGTNCRVSPTGSGGTSNTSYSNPGGSGNRTSTVTVSASNSDDVAHLVDGDTAGSPGQGINIPQNEYILFDFGSDRLIDEITVYHETAASTVGNYAVEGSDDASTWSSSMGTITFNTSAGSSSTTASLTNTTLYRYYRMRSITSSADNLWTTEVNFKISSSAPTPDSFNAVTVESVSDTADNAPSYGTAFIWLDTSLDQVDGFGTVVVTDATPANNHVLLKASRDGGTTWDTLPLTFEETVTGNIKRYTCSEFTFAATSGVNIRLRVESQGTGNGNPNFYLYGMAVVYDDGV